MSRVKLCLCEDRHPQASGYDPCPLHEPEQYGALVEKLRREAATAQAALKEIVARGPNPVSVEEELYELRQIAQQALSGGTAALDAAIAKAKRKALEDFAERLEGMQLHHDLRKFVPFLQILLRAKEGTQ